MSSLSFLNPSSVRILQPVPNREVICDRREQRFQRNGLHRYDSSLPSPSLPFSLLNPSPTGWTQRIVTIAIFWLTLRRCGGNSAALWTLQQVLLLRKIVSTTALITQVDGMKTTFSFLVQPLAQLLISSPAPTFSISPRGVDYVSMWDQIWRRLRYEELGRPDPLPVSTTCHVFRWRLIAGHETTASLIAWVLKYLADSPATQPQPRTSLYAAFPNFSTNDVPLAKEIYAMFTPYLDAVIAETLLLANVGTGSFFQKMVQCGILGHAILTGTLIIFLTGAPSYVSPHMPLRPEEKRSRSSQTTAARKHALSPSSHRSALPAPDSAATVFHPERWLHGDGTFDPDAATMLPFSAGPRGCFGKRVALLEMKIKLVVLIMRFDFRVLRKRLSSVRIKKEGFWEELDILVEDGLGHEEQCGRHIYLLNGRCLCGLACGHLSRSLSMRSIAAVGIRQSWSLDEDVGLLRESRDEPVFSFTSVATNLEHDGFRSTCAAVGDTVKYSKSMMGERTALLFNTLHRAAMLTKKPVRIGVKEWKKLCSEYVGLPIVIKGTNYFITGIGASEIGKPESMTGDYNDPDGGIMNRRLPLYAHWIIAVVHVLVFPALAFIVEHLLHSTASSHRRFAEPSSPGDPTVILTGFTKTYRHSILARIFRRRKDVLAVKGLDMKAYHGQIPCLLGPNGCGKSTTLNCISGDQKVSSGDIVIHSTGGLGYAPQKNIIWPDLTVGEPIRIFSDLKCLSSVNEEVAQDLAKGVDLQRKLKARVKTLSGGQTRKLQMAMMFAGGSQVCCVDEVSTGLDPISRRRIWEILLAERARRTIIMTTHFLDEADYLADEVAIMYKGSLRASGTIASLKHSYGDGYTVKLAAQSSFEPQLSGDVQKEQLRNQTVYRVATPALAAELVDVLEKQKLQDYQVSGPSMEELFLKVTGDQIHSTEEESVDEVVTETKEHSVTINVTKTDYKLTEGRPVTA
ncbi:hypothetical protein EJ02DRAFT_497700 [Clathrospora elynae]|uniref:ABC transporter domain-containing protein n=1 Tax=Clathrospora elynae TaxID=706981 RepID=A0A6A5SHQ0_9PLEO|nr:hypothetical protein EJ02DRAFT_497700 [Clathrospora elynae]